MDREGKLLKNTIILAIGTFIPKITSLITLPLLTAYLTIEEYGSFDLILTLVSLILPAVTLEIKAAAFRFLIEYRKNIEKTKQIVTDIYVFTVSVSVITLMILFSFIPVSSAISKVVICAYFLVDTLLGTTRQIVRGLSKNTDYSVSAVFSSVGNVVFSFMFVVFLKQGLIGAVLSLVVADFLAFLFLFYKSEIYKYVCVLKVNKDVLVELISYSWPMVPNSLGLWVMKLSDRLIVTAALGVSANAIYAVANKIPQLLTTAQSTFTMAWQESASLASNDKDVSNYYSQMFKTMYNLYVGCMALLIGMTPILFKLLINEKYTDAYFQMPILFFGVFFNCLTAYLGGIYVAFKRTKSVGITTIVAAITNLVIDILFVRIIGIYAASISTLVSYAVLFIYRAIDVQRLAKLRFDYKHIFGLLLVIVIECTLYYMRNPVLNVINFASGIVLMFILNLSMIRQIMMKLLEFVRSRKRRSKYCV